MKVTVNGKAVMAGEQETLGELITRLDVSDRDGGIAIAVNNTVVPQRQWANARLRAGDAIEVIHAVQGG